MSLAPGARLGPYELLGPLGAGGMGEVYRAHDARLGREVAIKVLPADVASDPSRLKRFEKEARAASALNHPNIVTIYDIGSVDSISFIAMELVAGKTLREALFAGPMPIKRLLQIAAQIADGLARAHEAGIVHRDLKPENVMVTKDGLVKILDFGLAKLTQTDSRGEGSCPPTETATGRGVVLGTVGYMSPEQAGGAPVDFRSDQFSFGSMLYEMATGKRAFVRSSAVQTLAAIIQEEPEPIATVNPTTPPPLRWIIQRCLGKQPNERYASTEDLTRELTNVRDHLSEIAPVEGPVSEPRHQRSRHRETLAWTLAVVLALGFALVLLLSHPTPLHVRLQASILPPEGTEFNWMASQALSPDGQYIVFRAEEGETNFLWLRDLVRGPVRKLPGTEGAAYPFWSPDSRAIGFFTFALPAGKLKRIGITGSPPQVLCDVSEPRGGSWGEDDVVLFSALNGPLRRVPATGGNPTAATHLDSSRRELDHRWPYFLPDGRRFLYLIRTERESRSMTLATGSLNSLEVKVLGKVDSNVAYAPPGYILSRSIDHSLIAQPFDARALRLFGSPYSVAERTMVVRGGRWLAPFSVSRTGVLAYLEEREAEPRRLEWLDRSGKVIEIVGPSARYWEVSLSPDGARVVTSVYDSRAESSDLWLYDLARGTNTRLTFDPGNDLSPVWSPDGRQVVFSGNRKGWGNLYLKQTDGSKVEELLLDSGGESVPTDWSSDGHFILYEDRQSNVRSSIWALPMTGERKPIPVKRGQFNQGDGKFSPDGHWIAYTSDETGRGEIYVTSFPRADEHWQVSALGGQDPRWSRNGRELFYASTYASAEPQLMAVEVKTQPGFSAATSRPLFRFPGGSRYDIATDGRFLVNVIPEPTQPSSLTVVFDWLPERKQ